MFGFEFKCHSVTFMSLINHVTIKQCPQGRNIAAKLHMATVYSTRYEQDCVLASLSISLFIYSII